MNSQLPQVAKAGVEHSGLQMQVLSLYRSILRAASTKDAPGERASYDTAREQFREHAASVKRMEFQRIEYLIRKGHKYLKTLQMPGVDGIGVKQTYKPKE